MTEITSEHSNHHNHSNQLLSIHKNTCDYCIGPHMVQNIDMFE